MGKMVQKSVHQRARTSRLLHLYNLILVCFNCYRYNTTDSSSQKELIKRNFLSLDVVSSAFDATFLVERQKFTDMDFVSEFAAALNLWAGISMAVIIEVIEVIIRVFLGWCKLERN